MCVTEQKVGTKNSLWLSPSTAQNPLGNRALKTYFLGLRREVKKAVDLSTARGKMKGNRSRDPSILERSPFLTLHYFPATAPFLCFPL